MDTFDGRIVHSSEYRNPAEFEGKRVLVVGLGNSGGEIALDLAEAGFAATLSVRGEVNIIPKEVLGIPVLTLSIAQKPLPMRMADGFNRLVQRLYFGDLARLGLSRSRIGPLAQVRGRGKIPLIDIGTIAAIRANRVQVRPGIRAFADRGIEFVDGRKDHFDTVILATGFHADLRRLVPDCGDLLTAEGTPKASGAESGREGLFFCGYRVSPTGQLREIGIEARAIAETILHQRKGA